MYRRQQEIARALAGQLREKPDLDLQKLQRPEPFPAELGEQKASGGELTPIVAGSRSVGLKQFPWQLTAKLQVSRQSLWQAEQEAEIPCRC